MPRHSARNFGWPKSQNLACSVQQSIRLHYLRLSKPSRADHESRTEAKGRSCGWPRWCQATEGIYIFPQPASHETDCEQQKKQWRVTRKNENTATHARTIQPGDSGIWATCNKGREGKCIGELRDLFAEYGELLYGDAQGGDSGDGEGKAENGIENDIDAELAELSKPTKAQLFTPVRVDVQCGECLE